MVNERDPSCAVRVFDLDSGKITRFFRRKRRGRAAPPTLGAETDVPVARRRRGRAGVRARDGRVTLFRRVALESAKRRKTNRRDAGDEVAGSDFEESDADEDDAPPPESRWRLLASVDAGAARLESLAFGPRSRLIGALSADGARVRARASAR